MSWLNLVAKGLFSGAVIVTATEIAKKSAAYGALVVSLPLTSIMAMTVLYSETKDNAQVADFAEGILWLVLPSLALFLVLPQMLRRGHSFEAAMAVGIVATILAYAIGVWMAQSQGGIS
tara:strand:- start:542 stop:898 length:357 start_codon:yes stop_codon:yes gene_type:complete